MGDAPEVVRFRTLAANYEKAKEKTVEIGAKLAQTKADDEKRRDEALATGQPRPVPKAEKIDLDLRQQRDDVARLGELLHDAADALLAASIPFVAAALDAAKARRAGGDRGSPPSSRRRPEFRRGSRPDLRGSRLALVARQDGQSRASLDSGGARRRSPESAGGDRRRGRSVRGGSPEARRRPDGPRAGGGNGVAAPGRERRLAGRPELRRRRGRRTGGDRAMESVRTRSSRVPTWPNSDSTAARSRPSSAAAHGFGFPATRVRWSASRTISISWSPPPSRGDRVWPRRRRGLGTTVVEAPGGGRGNDLAPDSTDDLTRRSRS